MRRIAVVTGASSGIGREFALQLDEQGEFEEIWLVARRSDRLEELARMLKKSTGIPVCLDLAGTPACAELFALLDKSLKPDPSGLRANDTAVLKCFVNNAGFGTYGPFLETSKDRQLSMIDLNIRTLTDLSYEALKRMSRGSSLINVASLASFQPSANFAVYAATKAYVLNLTMAIAAEIEESGIRAIALCPGPVSTEFALVASGGARKEVSGGKETSKVVSRCLKHLARNKWISIFSLDWKLLSIANRLLSKRFISRYTFRNMRRPQADKA